MPTGENLPTLDHAANGRKGGLARAEKIRAQKREDAERIEQAWRERLDKMFARLDSILEGDDGTALRAILAGMDRLAGRATERTELTGADGGPVVLENDVDADAAEKILRTLEDRGLTRVSSNGDAPADEVHPA